MYLKDEYKIDISHIIWPKIDICPQNLHKIVFLLRKYTLAISFVVSYLRIVTHMKSFTSILCLVLVVSALTAQQDELPKVMLIGEENGYYEQLVEECSTLLLTVTDNSMTAAFDNWTKMLSDMEASAEAEGFDIKGVKLWINLFWNEDGTVNKIFYYPKPNSKNMDFEKLSYFLENFASTYAFPITSDACFSHYGSASFPVRAKLARDEK